MQGTIRSALSASAGASGYSIASGEAQIVEDYVSIFDQIWLLGVDGNDWVKLGGALILALTILERAFAIRKYAKETK